MIRLRVLARAAVGAISLLPAIWLPQALSAQTVVPSALSETYDNWRVSCVIPQKAADAAADAPAPFQQCEMIQELTRNDNGQRVLAVSLQVGQGENAANAVLITPLGLSLPVGLALVARDQPIAAAQFSTCVAAGCVASVALTEEQIGALASAEAVSAEMTTNSGDPLSITLEPVGFAAAWARLKQLDAEISKP